MSEKRNWGGKKQNSDRGEKTELYKAIVEEEKKKD